MLASSLASGASARIHSQADSYLYLSFYLSIYLYLSILNISISISICLPRRWDQELWRPSTPRQTRIYIYLSIYLYLYPSIYLYTYIYL